jgi:hypothetical protein
MPLDHLKHCTGYTLYINETILEKYKLKMVKSAQVKNQMIEASYGKSDKVGVAVTPFLGASGRK